MPRNVVPPLGLAAAFTAVALFLLGPGVKVVSSKVGPVPALAWGPIAWLLGVTAVLVAAWTLWPALEGPSCAHCGRSARALQCRSCGRDLTLRP